MKLFDVEINNKIEKAKKEKKGKKNKYVFILKNKWTEKENEHEFNFVSDADFFKVIKNNYSNCQLITASKFINGDKIKIK